MEIYNEAMEKIDNPDLTRGALREGVRRVRHAAIAAVKEQWHYETEREYENGGRDLRRVIDVPGVEGKDAWEEEIPIRIYVPYTQEELDRMEAERKKPTQEARIAALEEGLRLLAAVIAGIREGKNNGVSLMDAGT